MAITVGAVVRSIPALLRERVEATPDAEAFRHPDDAGWETMSWRQLDERVQAASAGLRSLGVSTDMRVAIQASTRIEWVVADLAVMSAGGATTAIYPSSTPDECAFIIDDSDSRIVIAEDDEQVDKLRQIRERLPRVDHVVTIDGDASDDGWVITWEDVLAKGRARRIEAPNEHAQIASEIEPEQLATLIYTSGTTGRPKGVRLTHGNWLYAAGATAQLDVIQPDDLHFLWLPLSHSFGKLLQIVGIDVGVPTVIDGRVERIAENLAEVRPTVMAAAPRIFEKLYNAVVRSVQEDSAVKHRVFRWAHDVAVRTSRARQDQGELGAWLSAQRLVADRLVYRKLRARVGGRVRYFVSGSAPLATEVAEFLDGAGLTILEGYGLTETSAASFVNRPDSYRFGTVGHPLPGTEVRIARDGEILIAGPGLMDGYHDLPEETATTLTDGWLRTGDIGDLDGDGRLRITDRKKQLIKTSGGKYVAPQHVEGRIKTASPYISHAMVHGDRRNYCTALITLDADAVTDWAAKRSLPTDLGRLAAHPAVVELVQDAIDRVNADLASYETIKRFAIIPADFTVEAGELTPSLKLRRHQIEERYRDVLDGLYERTIEPVATRTSR